jgi:molybdopterin synthase catalytic subunit
LFALRDGIRVELVSGPIRTDDVRARLAGDSNLGGIVTFEGVTRADLDPEHGPVVRLEYEAYSEMAQRQLERLAEQAQSRWSLGRVVIIHRLGAVSPGEASVVIGVAAGHRAEAFEACRWLIDTLKKDVPIWKKDVYADGFTRWVQPRSGRCERAARLT